MSNEDNRNSEVIHLHFQEGRMENYFESFLKEFGGSLEDNRYWVDNDLIEMEVRRYALTESVDMSLLSFESRKPILVHREPDNDPDLFHMNIVSKGAYRQSFNDQNITVDHQTNRGAFLYNSLFPIQVEFEANRRINFIFFKFRASRIGQVFPDSAKIFDELFENEAPVSYHAHLGHRLNRLIINIFSAGEDSFNRAALIVSRGIELFSSMSASLGTLKEKDNLNGLHPEDFNRLQRIKGELLSNFDQKISMSSLSERHGVSVSKLKRDFKTLFGMSVYKFYNHSRMDEAYHRLNSGKFNVSEVGYDLGYSNLSKFSEMFKRIKGITPSQALPDS